MLSRTVLKHHYKIHEGNTAPNSIETKSTWDRLGITKKHWQSLTNDQRIQMNVEYYDRLDGGES